MKSNRTGNRPLLASPQGGVAEQSKNIAQHPLIAKPGSFSDRDRRKTTPAASVSVAAQYLFNDAAIPPRGDASRGVFALHSNSRSIPIRFKSCDDRACRRTN